MWGWPGAWGPEEGVLSSASQGCQRHRWALTRGLGVNTSSAAGVSTISKQGDVAMGRVTGAPCAQFFTCVSKHQHLGGSWTHGPAPHPPTQGVHPPGRLDIPPAPRGRAGVSLLPPRTFCLLPRAKGPL